MFNMYGDKHRQISLHFETNTIFVKENYKKNILVKYFSILDFILRFILFKKAIVILIFQWTFKLSVCLWFLSHKI